MDGEVIKSFLVGLGWDIDDASYTKFTKAIQSATLQVQGLYGSLKKIATVGTEVAAVLTLTQGALGVGIAKVAEGFEQMGYQFHILVPMINKTLYLRQELLKAYRLAGVNIRQVIGDSVKLNYSLAKTRFAFKAIYDSVAAKFFPLLTKQSEILRATIYRNMPRIQRAIESFVRFTFTAFNALIRLGGRIFSVLESIYGFFVRLDKATNGWSTKILAIAAAWRFLNLSFLASPLGIILSLAAALLLLYDDYKTFTEGGESAINWAKFIPTIREVETVLLAVWNAIKKVYYAFKDLYEGNTGGFWDGLIDSITSVLPSLTKVGNSILHFIDEFGETIAERMISSFEKALEKSGGISGTLSKILRYGFGGGIGDDIAAAIDRKNGGKDDGTEQLKSFGGFLLNLLKFSNPSFGAAFEQIKGGFPAAVPLGATSYGPQSSNINLHQKTNINISGAADAEATGRQVASATNRTNFDLVRNLKGAQKAGGFIPGGQ